MKKSLSTQNLSFLTIYLYFFGFGQKIILFSIFKFIYVGSLCAWIYANEVSCEVLKPNYELIKINGVQNTVFNFPKKN